MLGNSPVVPGAPVELAPPAVPVLCIKQQKGLHFLVSFFECG